jgi:hypothetical protein
MYSLSETELEVLRNWLTEMRAPEIIRKSKSSPAALNLSFSKLTVEALGYVWIIEVLKKSRLQIDTHFH